MENHRIELDRTQWRSKLRARRDETSLELDATRQALSSARRDKLWARWDETSFRLSSRDKKWARQTRWGLCNSNKSSKLKAQNSRDSSGVLSFGLGTHAKHYLGFELRYRVKNWAWSCRWKLCNSCSALAARCELWALVSVRMSETFWALNLIWITSFWWLRKHEFKFC